MAETLDALQARFAAGLLDPALDPTALFRGDPALAAARFALYRGNLTANWEKALSNAYPVLRQLVGEEFFRALSREYGRRHASAGGDLNELGAHLAAFLEDFEPTRDYPCFPDLARLEWLIHRAHYAADARPLSPAELSPAVLEHQPMRLRPGHALLGSAWALVALWQAHQGPDAAFPAELARPSCALVYRPDWQVRVRELAPGEAAALAAVEAGTPLAAALEAGVEADAGFDPGAALHGWLEQHLLAAPPKETP